MPPVEPVLPSTVTECARIAHAFMHGAEFRPGDAYVVMSSRPPLHPIYGVVTTLARGQAMYDAAEEPRTGWTTADANNRQLYGPIRVPARRARASGTSDGNDAQATSVMSLPAMGHTCWTDPYLLQTFASADAEFASSITCDMILEAAVTFSVMRDGEPYDLRFNIAAGTDAIFLTSAAAEEFLMTPYRAYYGAAYATALRRRIGS